MPATIPVTADNFIRAETDLYFGNIVRSESAERVFDQQSDRREEHRWIRGHSVRRMRRQSAQLPADHTGLELPRKALSSEGGNPEREVDVSGAAASAVKLSAGQPRRCSFPDRA